ncbi:MAG TPA: hypothetical protein VMT66_17910 [Steroidobacteraceae bacterium]|nr:hypothetical protein [Steroidobacteraceae bacterium]
MSASRWQGHDRWLALALIASSAHAQSSTASLCPLLPVQQIESLFGRKADGPPVGMDVMPKIGNCSLSFGSPGRMVILSTAPLTGGGKVPIADRIRQGQKLMESSGLKSSPTPQYQFLGEVVCAVEQPQPPIGQTTCMTDHGDLQYNLVVRSDDAKNRDVPSVASLLKAVVAKLH